VAGALLAPAQAVRLAAAGRYSRLSGVAAVLLGSASASFASWIVAPPGTRGPSAVAAAAAGHVALDLAFWYVLAALLAQSARLLGRPGAGAGERTSPQAPLAGDFLNATAVAFAVRAYLVPAAAISRLTGLAAVLSCSRIAVLAAGLVLIWVAAKEAGGLSGGRAALCVILGLFVPAAAVLVGLALAGLAWLLAPLLPKGMTPFPQI
jgi:hypothetical protein